MNRTAKIIIAILSTLLVLAVATCVRAAYRIIALEGEVQHQMAMNEFCSKYGEQMQKPAAAPGSAAP